MSVFAVAALTSVVAFAHGKLPVAFEPNQGQVETPIQYIAHGSGYTLALRADGAELLGRGGRMRFVRQPSSPPPRSFFA